MSQQTSEKLKIGDHEYEVFHLDSETGWQYAIQIDRLLMPIIGQLVEATQKSQQGIDAVVPFGQIGQYLADNLDQQLLTRLTNDLIKVTHVDGVPLEKTYKIHFRGRLGDHHRWFVFAAKANFQDFFSKLKDDFAQSVGQGMGQVLSSLHTSTG